MKSLKKFLSSILLASSVAAAEAHADESWYVSTGVSGMAGNYSGSEQRDNLFSGSLWMNADYLDNFSFALAYNNSQINFKDAGLGTFKINQDAFAGRLRYRFHNDSLGGKLTAQLVAHTISNDDPTTFTDDVTVIAPKLAYMNFSNDLYLDFEYVKSEYNNVGFSVQQLTSSIGFGFNQNADWIRLKAYLIKTSDKNLSQGEDSLASIDIKWTHWLSPGAILGINNFFLDVLAGERIFAVDNEAFSVYNLADVQQGSALLGLGWKFGEDFDVTAIAGIEKYENKTINNAYNQQYLYISMVKHW